MHGVLVSLSFWVQPLMVALECQALCRLEQTSLVQLRQPLRFSEGHILNGCLQWEVDLIDIVLCSVVPTLKTQ